MDEAISTLLERAAQALRSGQRQPAQLTLQEVLQRSPDHPAALQLLGIVAFESNRPDEAIRLMERAVAVAPDYVEAQYNLANVLLRQGRLAEAATGFRRVLALDPRHFDAQLNLGGTASRQGRLGEALEAYRQAIAINPQHAMAHTNYANVLKDIGRGQDAMAHYQTAIGLDPNSADAYNNLGLLYRELGQPELAVPAIERAIQLAPGNAQFRVNLRDLHRRMVPAWHFRMLGDDARNEAYRRAIEKAAPGRRLVLDIGTGSGLLAMMAARAGAHRVVACEMIAPLARVAERIIARNGHADRIKVVAKRSTQLAVGAELPEAADLLISEIVDAGLLGEGMMRSLRHANAALIAPDAAVIPQAATIWGALVECPDLRRQNPIGMVCGFDLGALDIFRNPVAHQQFDMAREPHHLLSNAVELARFDFRHLPEGTVVRSRIFEITADGTAQAVAFWFDLHLDEEITLSTRPDATGHWRQAIAFLERDHRVRRNQNIELVVGHTDSNFFFQWPESNA